MQEGSWRLALATLLVAACAAGERLPATDPSQNRQPSGHTSDPNAMAAGDYLRAADSSQVRQPTGPIPLLSEGGQIATLRPELLRQRAAAASEAGLDGSAGFPSRNVAKPFTLQVATLPLQLEPNQMQFTTSQTLRPNRMQLATSQTLEPNQMQVTTSQTLGPNRMQLATSETLEPKQMQVTTSQTLEPNRMQVTASQPVEPQGTASQASQAESWDAGDRVPATMAVPSDKSGEIEAVDGMYALGDPSGPVRGATGGAQKVPVQASTVGPDWSNVYRDPAGGISYRSTDPDEAVLHVPLQVPPETKPQGEELSNLPADVLEAPAALEKASGGLWTARAGPVDANTFCRSVNFLFFAVFPDVSNRECYYLCTLLSSTYNCCFNHLCYNSGSCGVRVYSFG
jgi:hypothetical protein